MLASSHLLADVCEMLEVALLSGLQWIHPKVRDDPIDDQREASYLPLERSIASVWPQRSTFEVLLDRQQDF